jgi:hypothetical protein
MDAAALQSSGRSTASSHQDARSVPMDSGDALVMNSSDATAMDCGDATGATSMNSGDAMTVSNVCAPPSSNCFSSKSLVLFFCA